MATSCRLHNLYLLHHPWNNADEENKTMNDCHFLCVQDNAEPKMATLPSDAILLPTEGKPKELI